MTNEEYILDMCNYISRVLPSKWLDRKDDITQSAVEAYYHRREKGWAYSYKFCYLDAIRKTFQVVQIDGKWHFRPRPMNVDNLVLAVEPEQNQMDDELLIKYFSSLEKPSRAFVQLIESLMAEGFTARKIAKMAGVHETRISQIRKGI